ncbi:DUF445 domain-containing protein [Altericroceibacterium spongiae]|uniref:DUF445 domain-containing protein n=1 Tax=Altericroceibacterium spongiae TaxID=2320269 RepID=A0A420EEN6_9SPHN|nr:DUF445 domain-containing protein [Altericroceibacterium spongiae]RKF19132.1 DUF445 domain-containing protein [Altericroceibacterium spongiae]
MRIIAAGLLLLMAAIFLVARHFEPSYPVLSYPIAFSEAAMVGGLADWFAVTALFRHPLGLPIPHTAIIPEKKNRIADNMAKFLQANFLTPDVVARRMRSFNLARAAGDFLIAPSGGGASRFRTGAGELLADILESLDPDRLGNQVRAGLKSQLDKVELSPLLGQALQSAIADKRHLPLLDNMIRWAGVALEQNEELVRDMVRQRANALVRWTGLDERLANSVLDGLYKLLAEILINPQHPLRLKVEEGLEKYAHALIYDAVTREKVEHLKHEIIDNPAVGNWWQGVWERMRLAMIDMARNPDGALSDHLGGTLSELGQALREDEQLQAQINRFARRTAVGLTSRHGGHIVQLVSETVRRWDARTISDRIEGAVGRDLQFIRINGTLVGGLVGLAIHIVDQLL